MDCAYAVTAWALLIAASVSAQVQTPTPTTRTVKVERPNQPECPAHAVCADIFNFLRDYMNGTAFQEQRWIVNCKCPETHSCPETDSHILYASVKHRQVLCEPVREACRPGDTAQRMHIDSDRFNGRTFFEVLCRCPRHRRPVPGKFEQATTFQSIMDVGYHSIHNYVCEGEGVSGFGGSSGRYGSRRNSRRRNNRRTK